MNTREDSPDLTPQEIDRFWAKVLRMGKRCWPWLGSYSRCGYGQLQIRGRGLRAHRVAFFLTTGQWPSVARHMICDNRGCCNPDHLVPGTLADNRADCVRAGRQARGERHVSRTHPEWLARGARHGRHTVPTRNKLTADDVRAIRRAIANGERQCDVAVRYGIGRPAISQINSRQLWAWVD